MTPAMAEASKGWAINAFPDPQGVERVDVEHYDGTVYDLEVGGQRLEALELGTAARHTGDGEISLTLPPDTCWAYRDEGTAAE